MEVKEKWHAQGGGFQQKANLAKCIYTAGKMIRW